MKTQPVTQFHQQRGLSLVELLIGVALTLVMITAAGYVYLQSRETQNTVDTVSDSMEAGAIAIEMIGKDIMNAGSYPTYSETKSYIYPPTKHIPQLGTDWIAPNPIYLRPVFGCDGTRFNPTTYACEAHPVPTNSDSIVLNYFTNDPEAFVAQRYGTRADCTGADIANDPSNTLRKNTSTQQQSPTPFPIFGTNHYTLTDTTTIVNSTPTNTKSLACGGNGNPAYMPMIAGLVELRFRYGIFSNDSFVIDRYYTAAEVNALDSQPPIEINNALMHGWDRVGAVKVCLLTQTLGNAPKIADKTGSLRTFTDCSGVVQTQAATDNSIYKRYERVFVIRSKRIQFY